MGGAVPKQFLALGGQPLVVYPLRTLQASPVIDAVILAVPQDDIDYCESKIIRSYSFNKVIAIVAGGLERQDSVRQALAAVNEETEIVVVHDAVRPFMTGRMLEEVVAKARSGGAAIVALPVRDTVKQVGDDRVIERTLDRRPLWSAQTPQAFRRDWLQEAHRKAQLEGIRATDDAYLIEWFGRPVSVVEGSGENIKVTRPEDLLIAEALLASRTSTS
jgi:2-C-methyl-D-erythritol 4-phosphate cytidylyltransferase